MKNLTLKKRKKEDNYYSKLQEKTLKRLEELSGKVWTDFNVHDPGITISDYFNYALYDLYYRFQFPFENYLFDDAHERDYSGKGLFPRTELFTEIDNGCELVRKSIVTEDDYEELLMKKHVTQLERCTVRLNKKTKKYDFFIDPKEEWLKEPERIMLETALKITYHQHRNLGEDSGSIYYDWKLQEQREVYEYRKYDKTTTYESPEFEDVINPKTPKVFSPNYHSVQYDFPENYGISERGIPPSEENEYQAKVLQLKAYLLIFDYLMADQLKQAKNVNQLFDLSEKLPADFLPDVTIVDGERIIDFDKKQKVAGEFRSDKFFHLQKFRYLNLLDMLYGEDTRTLFGKKDIYTLNQKRSKLLQTLPKLNEFRFRSFNINEPNSIPVVQQLLEEVIKERFPNHIPLYSNRIRIIADDLFYDRYRFLLGNFTEQLIEQEALVELQKDKTKSIDEEMYEQLRLHMNLIWHGILPESMLTYGTDIANYKIVSADDEYLLLFFHPRDKIIINMSLFSSDKQKLIQVTHLFIYFIRDIKMNGYQQSLYILEHILLEPNGGNNDLLSIIIPEKLENNELEKLIRERFPAHLRITIYYVSNGALESFHTAYFNWRKALSGSNEKEISYYSGAIHFFFSYAKNSVKQI